MGNRTRLHAIERGEFMGVGDTRGLIIKQRKSI